jgi:hypothetical protein
MAEIVAAQLIVRIVAQAIFRIVRAASGPCK